MEEPKLVTKVFADDSLELSCKAESAPGVDVTYLWFKCYQDGQIEELAERCLGSKMVVSRVTHSHQGYYKCVISPEVSSRVACVEVMSQTDIKFKTQPPHHQRIEIGKQLILSCEAACENYPVNYQWYHNKERLINANRSQLVIPQLAKEDIGFYHCDVRSEYSVEVISSETTRVQLGEFLIIFKYLYNLIEIVFWRFQIRGTALIVPHMTALHRMTLLPLPTLLYACSSMYGV